MAPVHDASVDPADYVHRLQRAMRQLAPAPTRSHDRTSQLHKDLLSCTHVFVRCDHVQPPLQPPYKGPYRVLDRADKYYTLDIKGKRDTVSLDRLKVAYLDVEHSTDFSPPSQTARHSNPDHPPKIPLLPPGAGPTRPAQQAPQQTTRSGRRVHWPAHYAQFDCG